MWRVALAQVRIWAASGVALLQKEMLANLYPKVTLTQKLHWLCQFFLHTETAVTAVLT